MADKRIIELEERLTLSDGDYLATDNTNGTCKVNAKILLDRLSDNEDAIATKAAKVDLTNISITGSTNNTGSTITSGSFFYKDGTLVMAKTDIANNATLTLNTNYEIVTAGGLNALNDALILDYDNKVLLNNILNGVNKTYRTPKRGVVKIACVSNGTESKCDISINHSDIDERMYISGQGNGYVPCRLYFQVNEGELLTTTIYTSITQLIGSYFIPYKG